MDIYKDPLVSGCVPKLEAGTWRVEDAVLSCENDIKLSKCVETAIKTDMGLDTPPLVKPLETNLQNITRNIFHTTTNQSMAPIPSPKLSNCRFRVSGQDG